MRDLFRRLFQPEPLRPPGARDPTAFAARCIRCGRCFAACPYRALRPAGWAEGPEAGTPVVDAQTTPCWLCMRCPPACPTGALAPVTDPREVRMGRAVVLTDLCYAHQGILCRTCVDECPFEGEAIHQDALLQPVVTERCVGCGVCEHKCPAPEVAIRVRPWGRMSPAERRAARSPESLGALPRQADPGAGGATAPGAGGATAPGAGGEADP